MNDQFQTNDLKPAVGQVWADNDPRSFGREVIIRSIDGDYAYVQGGLRNTRIKLSRFKPTRSGFRYVREQL